MVLQLLQDRLMSISHSDRQQLLEQKRQRLQELKQRRLLQQLSRLPTPEEPHALLFKSVLMQQRKHNTMKYHQIKQTPSTR